MWLRDKLFRKKKDFMSMLTSQSNKTVEGMKALVDFMMEPNKEKAEKVEELEQEADELRRILIDELNRSFVTPIDREDIFALSRIIDDMIDYARTTVDEMILFNVDTDEHLKKLVSMLYDGSKEISAAMQCLQSYPGVCQEHIIRAKRIENQVEQKYREALAELFKSTDVVTILKKREIYRHLSNAADKADEAANIIGDVLVKTT